MKIQIWTLNFFIQNFVFSQKGIFCSLRLFLHIRRMSLEWWKFLWEQDLYNSMILRRGFVGNWEEHLYDVDLKERNICMILRRGFVAGQTDVSPPVFRLPAPSCADDTWRTHCKAPGRDTRHKNTETQLWNTWHTWRTQHDDADWDESDNDDYDDDDVNCSDPCHSADDDEMVFPNSLKAANHLPRLLPIPARVLSPPNVHNIC